MKSDFPEYTNSQIEALIDEYIHSRRDRDILKLYFIDGMNFPSLARAFDMSERQMKTIVGKHKKTLREHL